MNASVPGSERRTCYLSAASARVNASAANAASQRARELGETGLDVIDLTVGEPDGDTPAHICEAALQAIRNGRTRYTNVDGTRELKQAVARKFARDNDLVYAEREISVGAGAKQIIFNALLATVDPGDEVVIPAPAWPTYPEAVRFAGGSPVVLPMRTDDFAAWLDQLRTAVSKRTKWLILNSPNNPSGRAFSAEELSALAEMLLDQPQVLVLSDDIYEHILFGGARFATLAQVEPRLKQRTLTVNGVSKAYAMTGWRIGFAGGPAPLIEAMKRIQSQSTSAPCSISQAAAVAALDGPQEAVRARTREFERRRDMLALEFEAIPGMRPNRPQGAFYLLIDCQALLGRRTPGGQALVDDEQMCSYFLMEAGVALLPATPFSAPHHLRLSFAASESKLVEACRRLRTACVALQ